jgi:hypothetical protein
MDLVVSSLRDKFQSPDCLADQVLGRASFVVPASLVFSVLNALFAARHQRLEQEPYQSWRLVNIRNGDAPQSLY